MNESINSDTRRFDCGHCRKHVPRGHRVHMLCGWEDTSTWSAVSCTCDPKPATDGHGRCRHCLNRRMMMVPGCTTIPTVCPGYSTKLPDVIETVRAWAWWDKGQLALRWPNPSEQLMDNIELFNGHRAMAQSWELQERQRRAGQQGGNP